MWLDEYRNLILYALGYLAIGCICMQIVINYYKSQGVQRIPIRFVFVWPLFLLLFAVGIIISLRKMYEDRN